MTHKSLIAALFSALLLLVACGGPEPEAPATAEPMAEPAAEAMAEAPGDLRSLLAGDARSAADRARDAGRKPADVIEFLGIESGMRVIDVIAAGGYYTEVMSLAVGADGHVVAQNPPFILETREGVNEKAISARLAGNRLPNVSRMNSGFEDIAADVGTYDAAITALNFHDIYNSRGPEAALAILQAINSLLKPDGVFGIIDHAGVADADNAALHRIEKSLAVDTAMAAGFVVEAESDILSSATDDHTQAVFAEGIRGKTDRFLLKLRKPAG